MSGVGTGTSLIVFNAATRAPSCWRIAADHHAERRSTEQRSVKSSSTARRFAHSADTAVTLQNLQIQCQSPRRHGGDANNGIANGGAWLGERRERTGGGKRRRRWRWRHHEYGWRRGRRRGATNGGGTRVEGHSLPSRAQWGHGNRGAAERQPGPATSSCGETDDDHSGALGSVATPVACRARVERDRRCGCDAGLQLRGTVNGSATAGAVAGALSHDAAGARRRP